MQRFMRSSRPGFLGPALMGVYAISIGAGAIAGEEGRGGLEVTLSAPVARGRVLAERAAALLLDMTAGTGPVPAAYRQGQKSRT